MESEWGDVLHYCEQSCPTGDVLSGLGVWVSNRCVAHHMCPVKSWCCKPGRCTPVGDAGPGRATGGPCRTGGWRALRLGELGTAPPLWYAGRDGDAEGRIAGALTARRGGGPPIGRTGTSGRRASGESG